MTKQFCELLELLGLLDVEGTTTPGKSDVHQLSCLGGHLARGFSGNASVFEYAGMHEKNDGRKLDMKH